MNNKNYEKKFEIQKNLITRQSKQIDSLKQQVENLKLELEEKDTLINSVESLKEQLAQNVADVKNYRKQYGMLIEEIKKMKSIIDKEIYRGRWWLIKFLIK